MGLPLNYIHIKWLWAIREKLNSFKKSVDLVQFVPELLFKPFDKMFFELRDICGPVKDETVLKASNIRTQTDSVPQL